MRVLGLILMAAAILVAVLGGFWLQKTYTLDTPYDEVWIGLNSRLPEPLRAFSCSTMRDRLGDVAVPPMGCEGLWN